MTDNHKVYINNRYLPSRFIDLYDTIFVKHDGHARIYSSIVTSINFSYVKEESVYNLEVQDHHNYFANNVLVSNCHHTPCMTWSSIAIHSRAKIKLGFSATPFDNPRALNLMDYVLIGLTGPVIGSVNSKMLFDKGYVVPPVVYFHSIKNPIKNIKFSRVWSTVYKKCIIENSYRNMMICMMTKRLALSGRKILIIVLRISHGYELFNTIKSMNFDIAFFHGDKVTYSPNIKGLSIEDILKQGGIIIATSGILSEGIDIPIFDAVINGQGCKDRRQVLQIAGRVVRPYKNKLTSFYIDFMDYTHVFVRVQSKKRQAAVIDKGYKTISNLFQYIKDN